MRIRKCRREIETKDSFEPIVASLDVFPIGVACMRCNKMLGELYYDASGAYRLTEYRILCNKCYDGLLSSK